MCVVNKQFELLECVNSVYVDLNEISLSFAAGFVCLCGVYSHVVDAWAVVYVGCEYAERGRKC